jgi:WD40 repeat protein
MSAPGVRSSCRLGALLVVVAVWSGALRAEDQAGDRKAEPEKPARKEGKWEVTPVGHLDSWRNLDAPGLLLLGSYNQPPQLWDMKSGKRLAILHEHRPRSNLVAVMPDGERLLTGDRLRAGIISLPEGNEPITGALCIRDRATGKALKTITLDLSAKDLRYCTDWELVAWPDKEKCLLQLNCRQNPARASVRTVFCVVDLAAGKIVKSSGPLDVGEELTVAPDGKLLVAVTYSGTVRLWGLAEGRELAELTEAGDVKQLAFSPDGKLLAGGPAFGDKPVVFWDVASRKEVGPLQAFERSSLSLLTFTADGQTLVTAGPSVKLWDVKALSLRRGD